MLVSVETNLARPGELSLTPAKRADLWVCLVPEVCPAQGKNMRLQTEDLSDWLQTYRWDYFITVTPRHSRTDPIAFIRDLGDFLLHPDQQAGRAFLAAEPFRYQHNLHVHGIVAGDPGDMTGPNLLASDLDFRFGRSRCEMCDSAGNVATYCSKYVTKLRDGDNYDFIGDW